MKIKFFNKIFPIFVFIVVISGISYFSADETDTEKLKAYFSVFDFSDEFDDNKKPFSTHNYDGLSDVEKQAYICIFENISKHPQYIKIPSLSSEEFNRVYFAVKNDNPDMLCFSDSCSMTVFGSASLLEFVYDSDVDECNNKCNKLKKTVEFIINEMPEFNDDYSKELYIHDYIVKNCVYRDEQNASSAYSCLIDGVAVCSGYSRAAMLLLKEAGIDSMLVAGLGKSASQEAVSHMWNIVWIDGEPYHLDVTWDDPSNDNTDIISHLYFNLTDRAISVDHSDYSVSFKCNAETYNYFVRNNLCFKEYSQDTLDVLKLKLVNNINNGRNYIEFLFTDKNEYLSAESNLIQDTSADSDIYNLLDYLSKYADDNLDISHINFTCDDNKHYISMMFDNIE